MFKCRLNAVIPGLSDVRLTATRSAERQCMQRQVLSGASPAHTATKCNLSP